MSIIRYIKSFKEYIPTWIICAFLFFWIFGWTFVVAIILLIIQYIQRKKIMREYRLLLSKKDVENSQFSESGNADKNETDLLNDKVRYYQDQITKLKQDYAELEKRKQIANEELISCNARIYDELQEKRIKVGEYETTILKLENNIKRLQEEKAEISDPKWERLENAGK